MYETHIDEVATHEFNEDGELVPIVHKLPLTRKQRREIKREKERYVRKSNKINFRKKLKKEREKRYKNKSEVKQNEGDN